MLCLWYHFISVALCSYLFKTILEWKNQEQLKNHKLLQWIEGLQVHIAYVKMSQTQTVQVLCPKWHWYCEMTSWQPFWQDVSLTLIFSRSQDLKALALLCRITLHGVERMFKWNYLRKSCNKQSISSGPLCRSLDFVWLFCSELVFRESVRMLAWSSVLIHHNPKSDMEWNEEWNEEH